MQEDMGSPALAAHPLPCPHADISIELEEEFIAKPATDAQDTIEVVSTPPDESRAQSAREQHVPHSKGEQKGRGSPSKYQPM